MAGATPNRKLPLPGGAGPVSAAQDIQKLATAVDTEAQDIRQVIRYLMSGSLNQAGRATFSKGALPQDGDGEVPDSVLVDAVGVPADTVAAFGSCAGPSWCMGRRRGRGARSSCRRSLANRKRRCRARFMWTG